ncbi:MAG TPA: cobyrinate a,c-diamide synthase [Candidatus Omnitrophota bacterium]|nr:cobyrinate a,c-diamide synthase [Candidatus Omnitrophota bacterium]
MAAPGIVLAAPSSGSGKTLATLGLLAHLVRRGVDVASAKVGPDYIDPAFHAAATGRPCPNLDAWAMRPATLAGLVAGLSHGAELVVCEGVMGLFDGAAVASGEHAGSTADVAALTGWPVVLVVDARGMSASAAAVVAGFARFRPDVAIKGVIFNKVSGERHRRLISEALSAACPEVQQLGFLPPLPQLALPSRHLGLVQACEHPDLAAFFDTAARAVAAHVDVDALLALARPAVLGGAMQPPVPPLGRHVAVARDEAFAFAYPAVLDGWHRAGVRLSFFSPLAGEAPAGDADAVYLPGGYPELHAGLLSAGGFLPGLRDAAARGAVVFGECGGYMVLGRALTDAEGRAWPMAGLLPVETSFKARKLHLGYRRAVLGWDGPLGRAGQEWRGHEFHFASVTAEGDAPPLFTVSDAAGSDLGRSGLRVGKVMGSFVHLIDRA